MKYDNISPELKKLLDEAPVLNNEDRQELAEANAALEIDPEFIADIIKGAFVNDILFAMEEQGLNYNQLAKKWGKSRQHVGKILDKEKAKNFTIDSMVSLSMTLGLKPQKIELKKVVSAEAQAALTTTRVKYEERSASLKWHVPRECEYTKKFQISNSTIELSDIKDNSAGMAA